MPVKVPLVEPGVTATLPVGPVTPTVIPPVPDRIAVEAAPVLSPIVVAPAAADASESAPELTIEVMSVFAPLAAAPMPERAVAAVVPPVPPWPTERAVLKAVSEVISLCAPLAAAPKLVRAPAAVAAPTPP